MILATLFTIFALAAPNGPACERIRIFDERPYLSGTASVIVCRPWTGKTRRYEDLSDYNWRNP